MNRKIVLSVNTAWNVCNFRAGLVRGLVRQGYEVIVLARDDAYSAQLSGLGCRLKLLSMDANGTSPGRDMALLVKYRRVLQSLRPMAYLGYTVKPNVYGSIAANSLAIPVINNIAGLGATFIHTSMVTCLVKRLYRYSLRKSRRVFFQNEDDRSLFLDAGLVQPQVSEVLPGSGIDLQRFAPEPEHPPGSHAFRFLLVSRMLRDKGVEEYAAAAEIVRRRLPQVEFHLLGAIDTANPNAIARERIAGWEQAGLLRYLDHADDVRPFVADADCIVLPSYREGVPHSLLEAAAMARPIIASDVAGCRDVVVHEDNGLLCQAHSSADLAEKMVRMAQLPAARRAEMGANGRRRMTCHFDERIVVDRYLDALQQIEASGAPAGSALTLPVPGT